MYSGGPLAANLLRGGGGEVPDYAFIGTATWTGTSGGTNTLALPGTVQAGDLVVVMACNSSAGVPGYSVVSSAGYTTIYSQVFAAAVYGALLFKIIGAGETSVDLRAHGAANGTPFIVQVFRGIDPITPHQGSPTSATGFSATPDPPSYTPSSVPALRMIFAWEDDDNTTMTGPSGFTNLGTNAGSGGGGCVAMASQVDQTGGALNPGAFSSSSDVWGAAHTAFTIAGAIPP